MKTYMLTTTITNETLYEGTFSSLNDCLENAVKNNINLQDINLRHQNLSNVNLDDAFMPGADFTGSNLGGANLSESYMEGAKFTNTLLYNACLCDSRLTGADFTGAQFGATDIYMADISKARFSTLSCYSLNFAAARTMKNCHFFHPDGTSTRVSRPPVIIHGLFSIPLIHLGDTWRVGHAPLKLGEVCSVQNKLLKDFFPIPTSYKTEDESII